MKLPFSLRRLALLSRGLRVDRDRPDLARLAVIADPEQFCWEILPHAARSFAVSIALLPEAEAKAAAVAYLYARMLDSYEDLHPDPEEGRNALSIFASRLRSRPLGQAPSLPADLVRDERDRGHLLLVDRCAEVDVVYLRLRKTHRTAIADLVERMATGMSWASRTFEEQGGNLSGEEQLRRYCHIVIGEPTQFVVRLIARRELTPSETSDALAVSEFVQIANVTRDIERDLARSVAYHPILKPYLGREPDREAAEAVQTARIEMTLLALNGSPAVRRLASGVDLPRLSAGRAASVAMFRFTEAHYQHQVDLVRSGVSLPPPKATVLSSALPAAISPRWGNRQLEETEERLKEMAIQLRDLRQASTGAETPG